jgi:hypothetical protein
MTQHIEHMIAAQRERLERARNDLFLADQAPALFKPEWTERAQQEATDAYYGMQYWQGIGGA